MRNPNERPSLSDLLDNAKRLSEEALEREADRTRTEALAADFGPGPNAPTEPAPVTAEPSPSQDAAEGLKALQRRSADRLGRLRAQGVEVPAPLLVDLKLQALMFFLVEHGLINLDEFNLRAESLLSNVLDQVEASVRKAQITQGVQRGVFPFK